MIENGKTIIGGDSAGTNSYDTRDVVSPKVFKVKNFVIKWGLTLQYSLVVTQLRKQMV
jgi:hypothetical protein